MLYWGTVKWLHDLCHDGGKRNGYIALAASQAKGVLQRGEEINLYSTGRSNKQNRQWQHNFCCLREQKENRYPRNLQHHMKHKTQHNTTTRHNITQHNTNATQLNIRM